VAAQPLAQPVGVSRLAIAIDESRRIVRAVRTNQPMTSVHDVTAMIAHAQSALRTLPRQRFAVLVDIRRALLADESRYAHDLVMLRRELVSGFRRSAFLVETQVGMLQTQRFAREEHLAARVYCGEAEALSYLAQI
jgi:hypothetical protein